MSNFVASFQRHLPEPAFGSAGRQRFIPRYFGKSSAFSIQLFCIDDRYETRLSPTCFDFLSRNVELTLFMLSFYFKQIFSVDSTLKEL